MLEVDSTRWDLVNTIVFSLVDANLIEWDKSTEQVDKAHEVILKALEDVKSFEIVKRVIIED